MSIKESSVAKLGSVCRRIYRIFSHAYFHHRQIFDKYEVSGSSHFPNRPGEGTGFGLLILIETDRIASQGHKLLFFCLFELENVKLISTSEHQVEEEIEKNQLLCFFSAK